jgi:hypothetical protein
MGVKRENILEVRGGPEGCGITTLPHVFARRFASGRPFLHLRRRHFSPPSGGVPRLL